MSLHRRASTSATTTTTTTSNESLADTHTLDERSLEPSGSNVPPQQQPQAASGLPNQVPRRARRAKNRIKLKQQHCILAQLPSEILANILQHLDPPSLLHFMQCSKFCYCYARGERGYWLRLLRRHYPQVLERCQHSVELRSSSGSAPSVEDAYELYRRLKNPMLISKYYTHDGPATKVTTLTGLRDMSMINDRHMLLLFWSGRVYVIPDITPDKMDAPQEYWVEVGAFRDAKALVSGRRCAAFAVVRSGFKIEIGCLHLGCVHCPQTVDCDTCTGVESAVSLNWGGFVLRRTDTKTLISNKLAITFLPERTIGPMKPFSVGVLVLGISGKVYAVDCSPYRPQDGETYDVVATLSGTKDKLLKQWESARQAQRDGTLFLLEETSISGRTITWRGRTISPWRHLGGGERQLQDVTEMIMESTRSVVASSGDDSESHPVSVDIQPVAFRSQKGRPQLLDRMGCVWTEEWKDGAFRYRQLPAPSWTTKFPLGPTHVISAHIQSGSRSEGDLEEATLLSELPTANRKRRSLRTRK